MATKTQFDEACRKVKRGTGLAEASRDEKLRLYGLYRRVVCGRCYDPIPLSMFVERCLKHSAWTKTNTMSVQDAMDEYVNRVNELEMKYQTRFEKLFK